MNEKKLVKKCVKEVISDINNNDSKRFSKGDFQLLVYAVLSDPDFKMEKWIMSGGDLVKIEDSVNEKMKKFLHKILKHAGVTDTTQRDALIESFEFEPRDIDFVIDAVQEAMWQYSEADKPIWVFQDKMRRLALKRIKRTGKFEGQISYKKSVSDRQKAINERKARLAAKLKEEK